MVRAYAAGHAATRHIFPIGHVKDFYFDDECWVVRYLVVETGRRLASRKVLISPIAISQPDRVAKLLPVSLTKEQVR